MKISGQQIKEWIVSGIPGVGMLVYNLNEINLFDAPNEIEVEYEDDVLGRMKQTFDVEHIKVRQSTNNSYVVTFVQPGGYIESFALDHIHSIVIK